ncbi:MAG: fructose-bisphosphate aldolase [Bacillota bacterium]
MRRLKRIFRKDGKSVIVAMDHGMGLNVLPELNDTGEVLKKIVDAGADAVLTTFGIAKKYKEVLSDTGLILRLDGGSSHLYHKSNYPKLLYSVEDALKMGADAVACMGFPGIEFQEENLQILAQVAAKCEEWGLPLIAEMLPGGFNPEPANTVENVKLAARIGCELGADVIKTSFAGTKEEFQEIVAGLFAPVVILGGDKTKNIGDLFDVIEQAMQVGAAGVAIGRNVWKNKQPGKITAALVDLVHHKKSAEECLSLID